MPDENLLATLETSLRTTRATRARRAQRLEELEIEAEKLRAEISEMDTFAAQTEATMFRILSSVISPAMARSITPSDRDIEAALQQDAARTSAANFAHQSFNSQTFPASYLAQNQSSAATTNNPPSIFPLPFQEHSSLTSSAAPALKTDTEVISDRFADRTIPQATAMLLREAGGSLHVNELYNRLLEGGFNFTGANPTISIAVSLNRNRRFRKVAPGTFDLTIRDVASQAS